MKILFIGDILGKSGRRAIKSELVKLKKQHKIDFVIANSENVSGGKSLEENHYHELKELGIDVFTGGNHSFFGNKIDKYIDDVDDLLVPENYSPYTLQSGSKVFNCNGKKIRITSLLGKSFMQPIPESPFAALDTILQKDKSDIHLVDLHAETTAEKIAFGLEYDGRITALIGTHTHVQTADERILPKGTAFLTDAGMTGPRDSVIGANAQEVIFKIKTNLPVRFFPAEGRYQFMGCVIEIDDITNKAIAIKRINIIEDV